MSKRRCSGACEIRTQTAVIQLLITGSSGRRRQPSAAAMHTAPRRKRSCLWRRSGFWDGRPASHFSSIIPARILCTPYEPRAVRPLTTTCPRWLPKPGHNPKLRHSPRKKAANTAVDKIVLSTGSRPTCAGRCEGHWFLRQHGHSAVRRHSDILRDGTKFLTTRIATARCCCRCDSCSRLL